MVYCIFYVNIPDLRRSSNSMTFLVYRCPSNGVRLLSNKNSSDVRFAFKAFDFRHDSTGFIYLHCEVAVCERNDLSCSMDCSPRTKRSVDTNKKSHLISAGPFFVQKDKIKKGTCITAFI